MHVAVALSPSHQALYTLRLQLQSRAAAVCSCCVLLPGQLDSSNIEAHRTLVDVNLILIVLSTALYHVQYCMCPLVLAHGLVDKALPEVIITSPPLRQLQLNTIEVGEKQCARSSGGGQEKVSSLHAHLGP